MSADALVGTAEVALTRDRALGGASERWSRLAHFGALFFIAMLYANPLHWFPVLEKARLGLVAGAVCAAAVLMRRLTGGERIRVGGVGNAFLFAYAAVILLSNLWTIAPSKTLGESSDVAKLIVLYVAVQNALDTPGRLRRFLAVGALASLAPAIGGVRVWVKGENLVSGFRTYWDGMYADPNRLAMGLVVVLPFAMCATASARTPARKLLFAFVVAAQLCAIVLTHSRSGSVAAAMAIILFLFRGPRRTAARGILAAAAIVVGLIAFAPSSFWQRSSTIAQYSEDASVEGRENSWKVMGRIVEERPLGGVGAGAFLEAWDHYAPLSAGAHHLVAHNIFMEILGELGVFALLFFFGFIAWMLVRLWKAGRDPIIGREARAVFAALAGYLVCEMVNGYTLSWFLFLLFACAAAATRLHHLRALLGEEERSA